MGAVESHTVLLDPGGKRLIINIDGGKRLRENKLHIIKVTISVNIIRGDRKLFISVSSVTGFTNEGHVEPEGKPVNCS